jgi:hypothetical protein
MYSTLVSANLPMTSRHFHVYTDQVPILPLQLIQYQERSLNCGKETVSIQFKDYCQIFFPKLSKLN